MTQSFSLWFLLYLVVEVDGFACHKPKRNSWLDRRACSRTRIGSSFLLPFWTLFHISVRIKQLYTAFALRDIYRFQDYCSYFQEGSYPYSVHPTRIDKFFG